MFLHLYYITAVIVFLIVVGYFKLKGAILSVGDGVFVVAIAAVTALVWLPIVIGAPVLFFLGWLLVVIPHIETRKKL